MHTQAAPPATSDPTTVLSTLDACVFSAGMALILATMPPADVLQLVCARRFLAAFPPA